MFTRTAIFTSVALTVCFALPVGLILDSLPRAQPRADSGFPLVVVYLENWEPAAHNIVEVPTSPVAVVMVSWGSAIRYPSPWFPTRRETRRVVQIDAVDPTVPGLVGMELDSWRPALSAWLSARQPKSDAASQVLLPNVTVEERLWTMVFLNGVCVTTGLAAVAFISLGVWRALSAWIHRGPSHLCSRCGYDIRASVADRCSECGGGVQCSEGARGHD
jgi:hypothetical protein